jgi:hypothetical protein
MGAASCPVGNIQSAEGAVRAALTAEINLLRRQREASDEHVRQLEAQVSLPWPSDWR